jgi:hypothetical protein
MGSSFGVALFGTIYAGMLPDNLATALAAHPLPAGVDPHVAQSPHGLHALPALVAEPIINAYAHTVQSMFLIVAPLGAVAFVVALFLQQVPLRDTSRAAVAGNNGLGEGFSAPASTTSMQELEKIVANVVARVKTDPGQEIWVRAGVDVSVAQGRLLGHVFRAATDGSGDGATLENIGAHLNVPGEIFEPTARQLVDAEFLVESGGIYRFTRAGMEVITKLVEGWRSWLLAELADWKQDDRSDYSAAIDSFAERIIDNGRDLI